MTRTYASSACSSATGSHFTRSFWTQVDFSITYSLSIVSVYRQKDLCKIKFSLSVVNAELHTQRSVYFPQNKLRTVYYTEITHRKHEEGKKKKKKRVYFKTLGGTIIYSPHPHIFWTFPLRGLEICAKE